MYRSSSFNVFLPGDNDYPTRIFSTLAKRSFSFPVTWEELMEVALGEAELCLRMERDGLLTTAGDYMEEVEDYFHRKKQEESRTLMICYTVTTECPLSCDYCFQRHLDRQPTSPETTRGFISLMERYLDEHPAIERLELVLFGGEPMERESLCRLLLEEFTDICKKRNLTFGSLMTTNGLVSDTGNLAGLAEAGLQGVQISFDGPREVHERFRNGTFNTIIANLPLYAKYFNIAIKYNITKENSSPRFYEQFLEEVEAVLPNKSLRIILEAIQATTDSREQENYFQVNASRLANEIIALSKLTRAHGIPHNLGAAFHPPCFLSMENSVIVQPDGRLNICDTAYDIPEFTIGTVTGLNSLPLDRTPVKENIKQSVGGHCLKRKCPYFPLCETGCFYEKYRKKTGFQKAICRHAYIETFIPYLYEWFRPGGNKDIQHEDASLS